MYPNRPPSPTYTLFEHHADGVLVPLSRAEAPESIINGISDLIRATAHAREMVK